MGYEHDGRHDFDFLFGGWRISNRKRVNPLVEGDTEWIEFDAESDARPDCRWRREHRHLQRTRVPRQAGIRRLHAAALRACDRSLADLVGLVGR